MRHHAEWLQLTYAKNEIAYARQLVDETITEDGDVDTARALLTDAKRDHARILRRIRNLENKEPDVLDSTGKVLSTVR